MESELDDAWDRLCVDPHREEIERGRQEGREAGEKAGYDEGYALGRTTAIDYGMEIGFIRGCSRTIAGELEQLLKDVSNEKASRIRKSLQELEKAISEFPSADEVFVRNRTSTVSPLPLPVENDSENDPSAKASDSDITGNVQRIRARFKVLTVQLGIPHISLQKAMAQSSKKSPTEGESDNQPAEVKTTEW